MLDVHPPHAAVHTWKDFFIHIITITIGLLIAIGLEQTVEYVHHLGQLQSVRHELAVELAENRRIAEWDRKAFRDIAAELAGDMVLLRASQASQKPPAARLDYSWLTARPRTGAWQAARQAGVLDLMPHAKLQAYAHLYDTYDSFMDALTMQNIQMEIAGAMARRSPEGPAPRDIDELVAATSEAQGKLAFVGRVLTFENVAMAGVAANAGNGR